jgi:hypothetical protein
MPAACVPRFVTIPLRIAAVIVTELVLCLGGLAKVRWSWVGPSARGGSDNRKKPPAELGRGGG